MEPAVVSTALEPFAKTSEPIRRPIRLERVDPDAIRVVRKLSAAGFAAYVVGGAVRDLLLGRNAKDFDIATNARPEEVRRVFRHQCRIIGRRFRLAQVFFLRGQKVFEVATFRRNPAWSENEVESQDLLIRSDNVFGSADEDATRRDFTINGLFYDCDHGEVLDWTGGLRDLADNVIRTIGDPDVRFREDPIRMLRAIKFAARLDFGIDPEVYDSMVALREEIGRAARPRVFEEVMRLLRGGAARRSIHIAWDVGILATILPELSAFLDDDAEGGQGHRIFRALAEIDRIVAERKTPPDDSVLLATLLREPIFEWVDGARNKDEWRQAVEDKISEIDERLAIPRRTVEVLVRLYAAETRLLARRTGGFLETTLGSLAVDLARITLAAAGEQNSETGEWLQRLQARYPHAQERIAREDWR
jgi:poly(A) polymerase